MLNENALNKIVIRQPLFFRWLQSEAIRELSWLNGSSEVKGGEFSRFHEKLLEKQIVLRDTRTTFDDDLECLALYASGEVAS